MHFALLFNRLPGPLLCAAVAVLSLATSSPARAGDAAPPPPLRAIGPQEAWSLRLPEADKPVFQGVVNFDSAGNSTGNAFMYPAPGLVGLLVAVAAHAAIESSTQRNQRSQIQLQADQVLLPYQPVLESLSYRELAQKALERTAHGGEKQVADFASQRGAGWLVESNAVFSMTQDAAAIMLDHVLVIRAPDDVSSTAGKPRFVRVVSIPAPSGTVATERWTANQGEALKQQSIQLLAESLDVALGPLAAASAEAERPYKTIRYPLGNVEAMERAQVLKESCDRLVIKTLRGDLMSVPRRAGQPVGAGCS
jgi:hypothetical protein